MNSRAGFVLVAVLWLPEAAEAFEVRPSVWGRGWFFGVEGTIEDTDLDNLDFGRLKGQPELGGGLALGGRHHVEGSYLRVRREEEGTVTGEVLGVVQTSDDVSIDLAVDYARGHYGYSLISNSLLDLEPFIEVGYLRERTDIVDRTNGQRTRSDESAVFPLPGLAVVVPASFPVRGRARATGIGTGRGHLIDVEGGIEGVFRQLFGGVGYRFIDFRVEEHDGQEVADVQLKGVYVQGGIRF